MSKQDAQQVLATKLRELGERFVPGVIAPLRKPEEVDPAIHLLLYSFMLWESTPTLAAQSLAQLYESFVDLNELRVAFAQEIAEMIEPTDALTNERAERIRASLNDIYAREHAISIDHLVERPKREVREYLESLEGMTSFVAARVTLLCFGGHAVPIDAVLVSKLCEVGVFDTSMSLGKAGRWLERHIRASQAQQAVLLMDAWREEPDPESAAPEPASPCISTQLQSVDEPALSPSASDTPATPTPPRPPEPHTQVESPQPEPGGA